MQRVLNDDRKGRQADGLGKLQPVFRNHAENGDVEAALLSMLLIPGQPLTIEYSPQTTLAALADLLPATPAGFFPAPTRGEGENRGAWIRPVIGVKSGDW